MLKPYYILGRDEFPRELSLGKGENASTVLVALPGVKLDMETTILLSGEGASLELSGLYVTGGEDRLSMDICVLHLSGGCRSRQLFKGVASDNSKVSFGGLVYVAHGAQKTSALQENHNILLGNGADVRTRPQLEIYADDVECSHGATTGFLRSDELFYMQSRGIPYEEARRLQLLSFLAPVMEKLPEELQRKIESLL